MFGLVDMEHADDDVVGHGRTGEDGKRRRSADHPFHRHGLPPLGGFWRFLVSRPDGGRSFCS
jgi:hypothetical protein